MSETIETPAVPAWALQRQETANEPVSSTAATKPMKRVGVQLKRVKDLNAEDLVDVTCRIIEFHPHLPIAAVSGNDQTIRLFHVDGEDNKLFQPPIFIEDYPIRCIKFFQKGRRLLIGGPKPYYYEYSLETNKVTRRAGIKTGTGRDTRALADHGHFIILNGNGSEREVRVAFHGGDSQVHIVNYKSNAVVKSLRVSFPVSDMETVPNYPGIITLAGEGGKVALVDIMSGRSRVQFSDSGNIGRAIVKWSIDGGWLAVGAQDGVVNIYRAADVLDKLKAKSRPSDSVKPTRSISRSLVDEITGLAWGLVAGKNLLALHSKTRGGMRVFDVKRNSVVPNWPAGGNTNPCAVMRWSQHSPESVFLAAGMAKGSALLWKVSV
ncbi:WD40 repeat protein [Carpediemonas membranifera]|uniref:WD40 repeat protein n=1 Tax=Carpediemonas membranifera TaxID=201153 RepID=A0A8J6AW74_9EUKA|nr:WD40 repeat protein [Carpediemonas membranifera]|eukprot:KAG9396361.1 WD40 repeat protein [Carpediemonas membranifera]